MVIQEILKLASEPRRNQSARRLYAVPSIIIIEIKNPALFLLKSTNARIFRFLKLPRQAAGKAPAVHVQD